MYEVFCIFCFLSLREVYTLIRSSCLLSRKGMRVAVALWFCVWRHRKSHFAVIKSPSEGLPGPLMFFFTATDEWLFHSFMSASRRYFAISSFEAQVSWKITMLFLPSMGRPSCRFIGPVQFHVIRRILQIGLCFDRSCCCYDVCLGWVG